MRAPATKKASRREEGVRCDDMVPLCDDRGGDLVGGAIDSMADEETAKFILGLGARLKQIEDESDAVLPSP